MLTEIRDPREITADPSGSTLQWNLPWMLKQINPQRWAERSDAHRKTRQSRRFQGNVRQRPDRSILRVL
jgi:hypothetical protein